MKKVLSAAVIAAVFAIGGCASLGTSIKAEQAISAAKAENAKAHSAKYEWRDTGKMLKAAEKAYSEGDYETALKKATKAKEQAELAQIQARAQKNAGPIYE
ncbi:MAG: DUF4398 domain-containing protein [Gammaproteobacteria bacterium]|jgi:uncharacterized protein YceK|nr:DUF4398 domain-containing protein [Gammaproteobacteria bacterium]